MSENLPPLPPPDYCGPLGTGSYFDGYTAPKMHTYARARLAELLGGWE